MTIRHEVPRQRGERRLEGRAGTIAWTALVASLIVGCGPAVPSDNANASVFPLSARDTLSDRQPQGGHLPFLLRPIVPVVDLELTRAQLQEVSLPFWPKRGRPASEVLHALHAFQEWPDPPEDRPTIEEMRNIFLDSRVSSQWYGSRQPFAATRFGVRFVTPSVVDRAAQAHIDQAMVVMAMLNVPLEQTFFGTRTPSTLADVVSDITAQFQLQGEFEWSALALVLYRPDRRTWTNRFGDEFTFDGVARALVLRPLTQGSCDGIHTFFTLAAMRKVDDQWSILSTPVREAVTAYLEGAAGFVSTMQLPDGSIDPCWSLRVDSEPWFAYARDRLGSSDQASGAASSIREMQRAIRESDLQTSLIATSHHVEWLLHMPPELRPDDRFFSRAATYLYAQLSEATDETRQRYYCPLSHSIAILTTLMQRRDLTSAP